MTSRIAQPVHSLPHQEGLSWLKSLGKSRTAFNTEQLRRIERYIRTLGLPCRFVREEDTVLLHIYSQMAETNSPFERPVPILTIRETQVPNGGQPHPHLGTIGQARLAKIAFNESNRARCEQAGIYPGSLRPGSIHPNR